MQQNDFGIEDHIVYPYQYVMEPDLLFSKGPTRSILILSKGIPTTGREIAEPWIFL